MNPRRSRLDAMRFDGPRWSPVAQSAGAAVVSLTVLGALAAALVATNQRVPGPARWTYPEIESWIDRQPVSAAFCLMSTVALVVVLYLMLSTVALVAARLARAVRMPRLERLAEGLAVPVIRRSLAALLGLGLTVAAQSPPAHGSPSPTHTPTEWTIPGPAATGPTPGGESPAGIATMRSLEPAVSASAPAWPSPTSTPDSPDVWTVQPGDHLWGLAESALTTTWARVPSDAEVADYVRAIIESNRRVLVIADHPDLVFPGQVFTRPAVPNP